MITEQTIEKMNALKLFGLRDAFSEQLEQPSYASLTFEERVGMLIDREWTDRENRKLERRMKAARLKVGAHMEQIDYSSARGIEAGQLRSLASCAWVGSHASVLITGKTGTGKTFIACALADQAIRQGYTSLYLRAPRLFSELLMARADGSYHRLLARLAKTDLLVIDDFALSALSDAEAREMLEVIEDRTGSGSVIIASQLPVAAWHEVMGEPTVADAVLDRIVHNSYRFELKGPSLRKRDRKKPPKDDDQ
jgi:DNA replication protein DnaC